MFSLHALLGRGATLAGLEKRELPIAKRKEDGAHFDFPVSEDGLNVDHIAKSYLHNLLERVHGAGGGSLVSVAVEGDGYCLTHAISKYFFGMEMFYHVIRSQILEELRNNEVWYTGTSVDEQGDENKSSGTSSSSLLRSMLDPPFTKTEFDELIKAAQISYSNTGQWSPHEHCQVLANILRRPVCLFTALKELNNQESFTYLPLRHRPEDCFKYPLSIAWQSRLPDGSLNHFVPLCRTSTSSAPIIPKDCQPPLYRCDRTTAEKYIEYKPDGSFTIGLPVQPHEIDPQHIVFTMGCKQKPHKANQPGLMYALVDKISAAARVELLALGGGGGGSSISSSDSAAASCSSSSSASVIDTDSVRKLELEFMEYCSLPVVQNPEKGLVAFDILLKLYASRIGFSALTKTATELQETLPDTIVKVAQESITFSSIVAVQDPGTLTRNSTKLHMDGHIAENYRKLLSSLNEAVAVAIGVRGTVESRARLSSFLKSCIDLRIAHLLEHLSKSQLLKVEDEASTSRRIVGDSSTSSSSSFPAKSSETADASATTSSAAIAAGADGAEDIISGLSQDDIADPLLTLAARCCMIAEAHSRDVATSVAAAVVDRPHLPRQWNYDNPQRDRNPNPNDTGAVGSDAGEPVEKRQRL